LINNHTLTFLDRESVLPDGMGTTTIDDIATQLTTTHLAALFPRGHDLIVRQWLYYRYPIILANRARQDPDEGDDAPLRLEPRVDDLRAQYRPIVVG
jgi:hypothetical protein